MTTSCVEQLKSVDSKKRQRIYLHVGAEATWLAYTLSLPTSSSSGLAKFIEYIGSEFPKTLFGRVLAGEATVTYKSGNLRGNFGHPKEGNSGTGQGETRKVAGSLLAICH